jgi:hypothetical protein
MPRGQELFDTYVRQHSVVLAFGEAGRNKLPRWRGPWLAETESSHEAGTAPMYRADPSGWDQPRCA